MPYFLVSIEPIYSQSVGNYVYLCDNEDDVTKFRSLLRRVGISSREESIVDRRMERSRSQTPGGNGAGDDGDADEESGDEDDSEDDDGENSSGWSFCESVWLIEEDDLRADAATGRCRATKLLSEEYAGFWWLRYEMLPLNYSGAAFSIACGPEEIPLLDCVHDNVECAWNIPFDDFAALFH